MYCQYIQEQLISFINVYFSTYNIINADFAGPSGLAVQAVGLRSVAC